MDNNSYVFDEKFQENFCYNFFALLHKTNAVNWQNGTIYFSNGITVLQRIFSRKFIFDDESLSKYFDYIDWESFVKYNKSSNISIEVRKFLFPIIRKKIDFYNYRQIPLFNPLVNLFLIRKSAQSVSDFKRNYNINSWKSFQFVNNLNKYCHSENLPDASLISKDKFIALYYSTRIQFDWNKDFIRKNADYLDWSLLSCNRGVTLTNDLIESFIDRWDWSTIFYNPSLALDFDFIDKYRSYIKWNMLSSMEGEFWSEHFIDTFLNELNWPVLCRNKSIKWDFYNLNKYEKYIDWKGISCNPSLELNVKVLDLYKERLFWDGVEEEELDDERGNYETVVVGYGISSNSSFPWNLYHMNRYKDFLDWEFIEYGNTHICWDDELINSFSDKLSWSFIFREEHENNDTDFILNLGRFANATRTISRLNLSHDLIIRYSHLLDRDLIFKNKSIDWNFSIFFRLFNYYFNNISSEEFYNWVNRYELFLSKCNKEINSYSQIQKFYKDTLENIDTTNLSVATSLEILVSNSSIFNKIFSNYFTEDSLYWATQDQ